MWALMLFLSVVTSHGVQGRTMQQMENATSNPVRSSCGGYFDGDSGAIYSPNYPNNYPNYAECTWYIRPESAFIRLVFFNVNTECSYDDVYVYDGVNTEGKLLGRFCQTTTKVFYSTGASLTVFFKSDSSGTRSGFSASYLVVSEGSCLNNCDNQAGKCSCYSDCGNTGNCCSDYAEFCLSTTRQPDYTSPTEHTPTAQPSCQYNCGHYLGSCSCSSTCRYNGNCCHDYHSYCAQTTDSPTTDQPSCRYNCGRHLGSCSCYSSCEYNGNCCHDYYSYCAQTTDSPTTDQPSCQYNCGHHLGSCSCSSNCQYYGNCCHDYYSYCAKTTDSPTTDQPSCQYNCGRHLGSCSCYSSCEYNGNCCHDFYSYCAATTTSEPCGGSLFGSGILTSPNHPSYYQNNAYCVWQLRAVHDQRIFLMFTNLQLENCCHCDYISIYDGPSVYSSYLGKVCNNSGGTFQSTSEYMTVLFRSDSSAVDQGFRAEFFSSLKPSTGRVDCSSDNMTIVIRRSYLNSLGYDGHSVYLKDPYCRPQISSHQVVFSFPLNTCGSSRQFINGRIFYTNHIRADPSAQGEISRQSLLKMDVTCLMEPDSKSQIMFVADNYINSSIITGSGTYNTTIAFYKSSSFYEKVTDAPYEVALNQDLYVQVDLTRWDSSLVLFLDTVVASPSPFEFESRPHFLVRDGCRVDDTYRPIITGTQDMARFTFKAFQFLRGSDHVYIQCKVLICYAYDSNSRCRKGCSRREARGLSEHDSQTLVVGPIKLKAPEKAKDEPGKQKEET